MTDPNEALRLKSLLFWLGRLAAMQKLDPPSFMHKVWARKDYPLFAGAWTTCPFCNGDPVFDPMDDGAPLIIEGIHIERVQCFCMTLEYRARTASRWYESTYLDSKLSELEAIDIPSGAGKRTESIKTWAGKFLANPTRSAIINGGTGTGKTHILQSIKTDFGGFAVYLTMADFFSKLMKFTKDKETDRLGQYIDKLTYAPILLFDDFGLQHETVYGTNVIASIIDSRYARRGLAPTIMTTNMTLLEMQPTSGGVVGNLDRLLSRMMDSDNSRVMTMLQADWRNKATRKEAGR